MVLRSYHPFEVVFSNPRHMENGKIVAEKKIVMPAGRYNTARRAAGKKTFIVLSEADLEFLRTKPSFKAMLRQGEAEGYVLMDDIPENMKSADQKLAESQAKNEALQSELDALKGKPVHVWTEKDLRAKQYLELREIAEKMGLVPLKSMKSLMVQIMAAQKPEKEPDDPGRAAE